MDREGAGLGQLPTLPLFLDVGRRDFGHGPVNSVTKVVRPKEATMSVRHTPFSLILAALAVPAIPLSAQVPDGWAVGAAMRQSNYTVGGGPFTFIVIVGIL